MRLVAPRVAAAALDGGSMMNGGGGVSPSSTVKMSKVTGPNFLPRKQSALPPIKGDDEVRNASICLSLHDRQYILFGEALAN